MIIEIISRVSYQNGASLLYIIVEIYHSGRKPSIYPYSSCHREATSLTMDNDDDDDNNDNKIIIIIMIIIIIIIIITFKGAI